MESPVPDTILPEDNFLLLQNDPLTRMKQASVDILSPPGVTLMFQEGLLWKEDKVPEKIRVIILDLCHARSSATHVLVARYRRKL